MKKSSSDLDSFDKIHCIAEQKFDIQIASDGRWYHDGGEIRRPALVKLFSSVLKRDLNGTYWLETPVEKGRIEVVDGPFIAPELIIEEENELLKNTILKIGFVTNVDDYVQLNKTSPLEIRPSLATNEMCPYIEVRDGLYAKLSRPVFYELAKYAVEDKDGRYGVWSNGEFFALE